MPRYFAVGGGLFCTRPIWSFGKIATNYDKIEDEVLEHALYREFGERCGGSVPEYTPEIRLFTIEQDAIDFAKQKEDKTDTLREQYGNRCPYYSIQTNRNWGVSVSKSQFLELSKDIISKKAYVIGFTDYNNDKYPQDLVEEATRPLYDAAWWLVLFFSFFTIIIPILYTLYRQSMKEDAQRMLEGDSGDSRPRNSCYFSYRLAIAELNKTQSQNISLQSDINNPSILPISKADRTQPIQEIFNNEETLPEKSNLSSFGL